MNLAVSLHASVLDNIPWNSASYLVVFLFTLTPSISKREIALIAQGFEQTKFTVKQGNERIASEFMGQVRCLLPVQT